MANPVIQFKRGVLANLPGLQVGEPGFTTDSYDLYVGLTSDTATNKIIGSHRFWTNSTSSTGSGVNLVEGTSNGTDFITLKSPDSLSGITTYTFPATATDGYFLKTNASGVLSWDQVVSNINIAADSGTPDSVSTGATITFSGGEGIDTTVTDNTITIAAELASDTNKGVASFDATDFTVSTGVVTVNTERVQDIVGAMVSSNTETLITVTYQDDDGTIDFVVDNDLANYSNATSGFIGAASTATLTNKTFDANGTGNSLSNVEVADFAASAIVTEGEGISANDNDTTLPTSAAVKDYTDTAISGIDLTLGINADSGGPSTVATSQTLTVSGTAGEIETSVSGQTITVGLPDNITVGSALTVTGDLTANGNVNLGNAGSDVVTVVGVATFTTSNVYIDNSLFVGGLEITGGASIGLDVTTRHLSVSGVSTFTGAIDANGGADIFGHTELDTVNVGTALTSASLTLASGATVTAVLDEDNFASNSATAVPTQQSTKAYVDNSISGIDLTLGINADSGGPSTVATSQTLTVSGTTNEVETSVSGQTITVGLPNDVTIGNNLTVTGNLYVNGSTTQVNTSSMLVEDRTIELGMVNGSAPSATTTWDLGILFNYYQSSAKKAAVAWEQGDGRFKFASVVSDGGGTDNDSPQLTFTTYAPIEISALWVNDCAGQSQVISCTGTTRYLENITIDGGTF